MRLYVIAFMAANYGALNNINCNSKLCTMHYNNNNNNIISLFVHKVQQRLTMSDKTQNKTKRAQHTTCS